MQTIVVVVVGIGSGIIYSSLFIWWLKNGIQSNMYASDSIYVCVHGIGMCGA